MTAALADLLTTAADRPAHRRRGRPAGRAGRRTGAGERAAGAGAADRHRVTDAERPGRPRSGSTSAARRSPAGSSPPDGTIVATARRATPGASVADTEDAIAAVVEELAAGHDGELVGVGVGAAGWFDRTGDTVLFSPHLAWRNSTLRKDLAAPAAAAAVGRQRRRRRGLGRVPLRRGPRRGPGADDHAGHRHRRRDRPGRAAAARLARGRGGVGAHAGRPRRPAVRLRQPRLLGAVRQRHRARADRPRGGPHLAGRRRPAAGAGRTASPTGSPARTSPARPRTATRWPSSWSPRSACGSGRASPTWPPSSTPRSW